MVRKKDRTCIAIHSETKAVFERRDATFIEEVRMLWRGLSIFYLLGMFRLKLALICWTTWHTRRRASATGEG
jgi:hypothetical protein